MGKWLFIVSSFVVMVSFQNCAKSNLNSIDQAQSANAPAEYDKVSTENVSQVSTLDEVTGVKIQIDVATGKVEVYARLGQERRPDHCLTVAERTQLQNLLSTSELCLPLIDGKQFTNKQCTMLYKAPYAELMANGESVKLGEMTSGCDVPSDLCGSSAQTLRDFVRDLLQNLDSKTCN